MAGALLVFYMGTASVGSLIDVSVGVQVIIGAVLGGRRTIIGAALGATFLIAAGEALRPLGTLSTFVVSLVALIVIMLAPGGLLGVLLRERSSR
jgi:branched-chain amino acid transport system permease protein